jgi:nitrogen fixation protein NifU and related proteins
MDDLDDLYQEIILSHNKRPRNEGPLDPCDCQAEGYNPLCGDKIRVYVRSAGGCDRHIDAVSFTGEGCAISRASASIMTEAVKNRPRAEVDARIAEALQMLTSREDSEADLMTLGDLAALAGVRKFPPRVKCATLAWHTLESALKGEGSASTEQE